MYRIIAALIILGAARPLSAADVAVLNEATWSEFAPGGKEVDAIYGDVVLRSDKLVAVVAAPLDTRNANMTVKNVGGCLIDLTLRERQNDQLPAFYPLGKAVNWRTMTIEPRPLDDRTASGDVVVVRVSTTLRPNELTAETRYVLADGADYLTVDTTFTNLTDKPLQYVAKDETNAQGGFAKGTDGNLTWIYDRWWDAAYGIVAESPKDGAYEIPAQGVVRITRAVYAATTLDDLQRLSANVPAKDAATIAVTAGDRPLSRAYVELRDGGRIVTAGRTDSQGRFSLPEWKPTQHVVVSSPAHGERTIENSAEFSTVDFPLPGIVSAVIVDANETAIPCKVKFRGLGDTKDPLFFDKTGEHAVGNLYYSHDGRFALDLTPGTYDVTLSRGPEYDVVERRIDVRSGATTSLEAKLLRSVQTPGWISADFHNHATPSGDNTASQFGRVLNLLAEHVEFAPCTEHNRVSSYLPHLARLKAGHLMATCSGIELTGYPFSVNHHNAFPIKLHEHKQDGGGPTVDPDTETSVERLVLWDDRSPKLIQQNHPDLGYLYFDKNGDGIPDEGFSRALGHLDCIEVHPPHLIFEGPVAESKWSSSKNNPMFNWLQLLNQGYRLPGVVNTDAHYNIHGSGWLRNYVACTTDDPAKIDIHEMVHAAEHGRMVMTNAPFLEATVRSGENRGGPGDDVIAVGGRVVLGIRVQCANWYDIDRVQVFLNGKPDPTLNFTRKRNPDVFADGVVKFDRELELQLTGDTHVVAAAIGENSGLGHVMGPEHEHDRPTAVSNPIFIDVDGNGFQANKDTLGVPLPVKAPGK